MSEKVKKPQSAVIARLNRYEKGYGVLRLEDGQEVFWPKNQLAKNISVGSKVFIIARTEEENSVESKELAKNILEEILNGGK